MYVNTYINDLVTHNNSFTGFGNIIMYKKNNKNMPNWKYITKKYNNWLCMNFLKRVFTDIDCNLQDKFVYLKKYT